MAYRGFPLRLSITSQCGQQARRFSVGSTYSRTLQSKHCGAPANKFHGPKHVQEAGSKRHATTDGIKKVIGDFDHALKTSDLAASEVLESASQFREALPKYVSGSSSTKSGSHEIPITSATTSANQTVEKVTKKKLEPLDPKSTSSGLNLADSNPTIDVERLIAFLSDDNVLPPHPKWKPSTRDRIKESGERVWKEDFEVENLIPYTSRLQYTEQQGAEHYMGDKENHKIPNTTTHSTTSATTATNNEWIEPEDIEVLDKTLKAARSARIQSDNDRFRHENWFQYNSGIYYTGAPRTIERGNFFTPVYADEDMWSSRRLNHQRGKDDGMTKEYIILTPNQKVIRTNRMPFNQERSSRDMFSILSRLSEPEKYIKTITRLENQGWKIIGGGGQGNLIVFERQYNKKTRATKYMLKIAFGLATSVGSLVLVLLAITELPST